MRGVTGLTALDLDRSMLVDEGAGLVGVTLDAIDVAAGPGSQLLDVKAAMLIMTIRAPHSTLRDLMMERARKRGLLLGMALITALRLSSPQKEFRTFW